MKNKIKLLAGRVGIYLFLVLRIYSIWSWVYRWLFERQYRHIKLAQVQSLEEARLLLRNVQYVSDGWRELGDAAASPQKIQAIIDGKIPQQTHGTDCDDFSCWLAKAVDTALVTLENPIQENEPGLWEAGVLTVTWMTPSGRFAGHNVCWLHYKTEEGDFYRYMDYGHPSEASLTLKETAYKVIDMYAPGSHLLAYAKQSCNFWVREVVLGPWA